MVTEQGDQYKAGKYGHLALHALNGKPLAEGSVDLLLIRTKFAMDKMELPASAYTTTNSEIIFSFSCNGCLAR